MKGMSLRRSTTEIFKKGLEAVLPFNLVHNTLKVNKNVLFLEKRQYLLNNNVYVVGFGKAVLGMAKAVEETLNGHVQHGILSVPFGLQQSLGSSFFTEAQNMALVPESRIVVKEGARHNLPDKAAWDTAAEIEKIVGNLKEEDLLFVLVSGGGSALLPAPVEFISLSDKLATIKLLTDSGSTIQDLNTIRKKLSRLKGGKLVGLNRSISVVSLILSDIVGDPIDLISSGPTVPDLSTFADCLKILDHYSVKTQIPNRVLNYIMQNAATEKQSVPAKDYSKNSFHNVQNIIIGNNTVATKECKKSAECLGFPTVILTTSLTGNVKNVASSFAGLLYWLIYDNQPDTDSCLDKNLLGEAYHLLKTKKRVCIITAGETTVAVTGNGRGGRNQELALLTAHSLHLLEKTEHNIPSQKQDVSFCFLSAGTDGQDGPTDAAGAFVNENTIINAKMQELNVENFLANNGSYDFFTKLDEGRNLFKTGLTGTNVMDMQILVLERKS